jgi:hypothetical protein
MVGLLRVFPLRLLSISLSLPPDRDVLLPGGDYRLGVELVPQQVVVLRRVVSLVAYPHLDRFDVVCPPHHRLEITVVVGWTSPDLDRRHELGLELRSYRELDEAPRLLSFCLTYLLIEDSISRFVLRT